MAARLKELDTEKLQPDDLLTPSQIAKLIPGVSAANHGHRNTVRRWLIKGITVCGKKVKLRCVRQAGGGRLVRWGDYVAFRQECDRLRGEGPEPPPESPAQRKRRSLAARAEAEQIFKDLYRKK